MKDTEPKTEKLPLIPKGAIKNAIAKCIPTPIKKLWNFLFLGNLAVRKKPLDNIFSLIKMNQGTYITIFVVLSMTSQNLWKPFLMTSNANDLKTVHGILQFTGYATSHASDYRYYTTLKADDGKIIGNPSIEPCSNFSEFSSSFISHFQNQPATVWIYNDMIYQIKPDVPVYYSQEFDKIMGDCNINYTLAQKSSIETYYPWLLFGLFLCFLPTLFIRRKIFRLIRENKVGPLTTKKEKIKYFMSGMSLIFCPLIIAIPFMLHIIFSSFIFMRGVL
jgi:hypothetical protein